MSIRSHALPVAAVRDLLGIVRALYGWHKALDPTDARLPVLHTIGRKLALALKLARSTPGSMGHTAAWGHAEDAVAMLGEALSSSAGLGDVLTTAKRRALTTATPLSEGEQRRLARARR